MVQVMPFARKWPLFALVGVVFLMSNIASAFFYERATHEEIERVWNPYDQVDIIRAGFDEDESGEKWFYFFANFNKIECDIETFRVVVKYAEFDGLPTKYFDIDDLPESTGEGQLYNRSSGAQTIRIRFKVDPDYEWIEFRTSHICPRDENGAERVPRLFARVSGAFLPTKEVIE